MDEDDGVFAALLDDGRAGDEAALAAIYRRHQGRLLRILRSEVRDAADDVASQTWLEVFGALGRFEGGEREFRSFLFTVARRRVADHRRTAARHPATAVEPEVLHASADASPGVESLVVDGLDGDGAVRRIVEILGEEIAGVVLLRVVGGFSTDEVATLTGRSPGSVRVLQHRALKKLGAALGEGGAG